MVLLCHSKALSCVSMSLTPSPDAHLCYWAWESSGDVDGLDLIFIYSALKLPLFLASSSKRNTKYYCCLLFLLFLLFLLLLLTLFFFFGQINILHICSKVSHKCSAQCPNVQDLVKGFFLAISRILNFWIFNSLPGISRWMPNGHISTCERKLVMFLARAAHSPSAAALV